MFDFVWVQQVVFPILGMGMATFFGWQILRIINGHLERKGGKAGSAELARIREEVERLRLLIEGSDDMRLQIGELEERVEFAERLLTRQRDQLKAGSD